MRCIRRLGERLAQGGSFLFAGEEVWFLEVLYLKLSLLGDLVRFVFSDFLSDRRPDFGFPIDQVWVELSAVGGLLPSFWSFRTGPLALLVHQREVPQAPPAYGLHLLGLGCMAVLLANSGQDISQVYRSLSEEMAAPSAAGSPLSPAGTFAPENIFWKPGTRTVSDEYRPLWEKALGLGWSLLRAAVGSDPPWSKEKFLAQVDELRREVRTGLFQTRGVPAEDTNEAVHQILVGISRRWLPVLERAAKAPAKTVPKAEPDKRKAMEEIPGTVMISPEERAKLATRPKPEMPPKPAKEPPRPAPQPPPRPPAKAKVEEEEVPATVMISPEKLAKMAAQPPPKTGPPSSRAAAPPPPKPPVKTKAEEDEIPSTVMISPGVMPKIPGHPSGVSLVPEEAPKKIPGKKAEEPPSDDFILKTVFIAPERRNDKDSEEEQ